VCVHLNTIDENINSLSSLSVIIIHCIYDSRSLCVLKLTEIIATKIIRLSIPESRFRIKNALQSFVVRYTLKCRSTKPIQVNIDF
jgi:hypothetical protein